MTHTHAKITVEDQFIEKIQRVETNKTVTTDRIIFPANVNSKQFVYLYDDLTSNTSGR